jgi:bacterioferritin-associated ferredoxin
MKAIDKGAESVRDLQRCGIGDQCGSCHNSLRAMLTRSADSCPVCVGTDLVAAHAV